jgi:hypothetical protein
MGFAGYVAVCVQLYCRCFTVLQLVSLFTLHVSAYMAIFMCVGCFYFRIPEGICFVVFTCTWLHFARFHLWGWLHIRYYLLLCSFCTVIVQCVHKVHSGFWKIVARKQIELVTCGLRIVDFVELRTNDARIVSTHSSLTPGMPLLLRSWTLPVSRKRRCQSLIA